MPLPRPLRVCDDDGWPLRWWAEQVRQEVEQGVQTRCFAEKPVEELEKEQEERSVELRPLVQQELPVAPLAQPDDLVVRLPQRVSVPQLEPRHLQEWQLFVDGERHAWPPLEYVCQLPRVVAPERRRPARLLPAVARAALHFQLQDLPHL